MTPAPGVPVTLLDGTLVYSRELRWSELKGKSCRHKSRWRLALFSNQGLHVLAEGSVYRNTRTGVDLATAKEMLREILGAMHACAEETQNTVDVRSLPSFAR